MRFALEGYVIAMSFGTMSLESKQYLRERMSFVTPSYESKQYLQERKREFLNSEFKKSSLSNRHFQLLCTVSTEQKITIKSAF